MDLSIHLLIISNRIYNYTYIPIATFILHDCVFQAGAFIGDIAYPQGAAEVAKHKVKVN